MKELVCLSGFSGVGKDEAARVLVERHGFTKVAFADKLREALYLMNPYTVANSKHHGPLPDGYGGPVYRTLQSVIDEYGWEGYKSSPFSEDLRRLIQRLGTQVGRQTIHPEVWIDATLNALDLDGRYVISDGRFFNEFNAVRARGGHVWRINRSGVGPINNHESELEAVHYPHFSLHLQNDGTLGEWDEYVDRAYRDGAYRR